MAEDSDLERTEDPTSRRLEQAREEGQVPHSRELSSFLVLAASVGVMWGLGAWSLQRLESVMRRGLEFGTKDLVTTDLILPRVALLSQDALLSLGPFLLASFIAALLTPFLLNAWVFSPKALAPNFSRLDPISGLGRIVSVQGFGELVKAILKSLLIGGVGFWMIWSRADEIVGLIGEPLEAGLAHSAQLIVYCLTVVVAAMILIVAVDVPFQLWRYNEQLKMTKEEVRQESKEMEGDPHVKGRIRALQRESARRRMMSSVPKADVIVTNPTHFSVALSYKTGMKAPKVVAKGRGELALKIREIGSQAGVPLLEAPPLARALYRWAEIDDEIPSRLYAAVAEVLAYVYQLNRYREIGGQYPVPPQRLEVPAELDPGLVNG